MSNDNAYHEIAEIESAFVYVDFILKLKIFKYTLLRYYIIKFA